MRPFCLLFCYLLTGSLVLSAQDCEAIKAAADRLKGERENLRARNEALKASLLKRQEQLDRLGGERGKSPHYPPPAFDESPQRYHDDRGHLGRCVDWGPTDWGKIKDFREVNCDKLRYGNQALEREIDRLDSLIDRQVNTDEVVAADPGPDFWDASGGEARAWAADRVVYRARTYAYCQFDPRRVDLRITSRRSAQQPYGFDQLQRRVARAGQDLVLAMNAGMYEPDKQPVGLLIARGRVWSPLNQRQGQGNFYMQDNGVFGLLTDGRAFVMSTEDYVQQGFPPSQLRLATQSGPVMLQGGQINPQFTAGSDNQHFRNAVGLRPDGQVVFAISEQRVSFYAFASFLLSLGCTDALYLDGAVSRMYLPALHKVQALRDSQHLGPVLYLVE